MKIRKAKKEDIGDYVKLKRLEEKDYSKIVEMKIKYPSNTVLKKEFKGIISSNKNILLFAEEDGKIIGYIHGTFFSSHHGSGGYGEDMFVLKGSRKKGVATSLIKAFMKILKSNGYGRFLLSVNVKNKNAINLYKKLGFEIYQYSMRKELK